MTQQLSHYGVPGMKWGRRKESYDSATRSEKKTLRKDYKQKFNREIDTARSRVGQSRHRLNQATEKLNAASLAKKGEGKAVHAYQKAKTAYLTDRHIAKTMKFGKETTLNALFVHGPVMMAVKDKQRRNTAALLDAQGRLKQK